MKRIPMTLTTAICAIFIGLMMLTLPTVHASERPTVGNVAVHVSNYDVLADFLKSDEGCRAGHASECSHFAEMCPLMTPEVVSKLTRYMRNEPPFRTRNGGSNITSRFPTAISKCHQLDQRTAGM